MNAKALLGERPKSPVAKLIRNAKDGVRATIGRFSPDLARRLTNFHRLDDRVFMESVILPFFRDNADVQTVMWIGTEWYTKPYEKFFMRKDYWTLEIDPSRKRFGSKKHIVAPMSDMDKFAPHATFDAILCNGVFYPGGVVTRADAEASLMASFKCLKPGGWFVLGWDDVRELRPVFPLAEVHALTLFEPAMFPPIGKSEHLTQTEYCHTYSFYRRPA